MLFDTHMHTNFSADSKMTINEVMTKAKELNIGVIITEHMDLDYPGPLSFEFDVNKYFETYNQYRSDKLLLGIEIGMCTSSLQDNCRIVDEHPFDYVIGSIHVADNIDIYTAQFYEGRTKAEAYHQYFNSMINCLKCYDCINSLGHIDYICRYARYEDTEIYYEEFCEHIDEILTLLAQKDSAIEINTRRLDNKQVVGNLIPIYKRFAQLGGKMATIGSDAHKPNDIGRNMNIGLEIAQRTGLQPVYFKNRVPQYIKKL